MLTNGEQITSGNLIAEYPKWSRQSRRTNMRYNIPQRDHRINAEYLITADQYFTACFAAQVKQSNPRRSGAIEVNGLADFLRYAIQLW